MIENKKIEIIKEKEYILIDIKEDCSFLDYIDETKNLKENNISIPTTMFIIDPSDYINSEFQNQKIYIFKNNDINYIVAIGNKKINILEKQINYNYKEETILKLSNNNDNNIYKYIYKLNNKLKEYKTYNNDNKKEYFCLVQKLLDNIKNVPFLYKIINIYPIYYKLNLIPNTWYNPIISDDVITLSSDRYSSIDTVNNKKVCSFYIILNDTKEQVGKITFNLEKDGFTYDGNVGYEIKEKFRNMGYASRALKLLKEIVKTNKYVGDKDIFISTISDNLYSQKVAINNNGELIYDGDVPKKDPFNYKYGIDKVKVYQIRMNREQINN